MTIKEVVIKVENRPGEFARIVGHLYENDVKVSAFWVGTENEKATLRFVTSDPDSALSVLTGLGFKPTTSHAIAAQVPDHPGGLNTLLMILRSAEINILHIYPCLETQDPILILEVDNTEAAVKALKSNWINLYDERLYYM
ncbi:MAG: hypothetical protein JW883_08250 [Deltaproteobacteria bacterium]|nr:hypothetical protein [Deltaproteobacteria bacterium]